MDGFIGEAMTHGEAERMVAAVWFGHTRRRSARGLTRCPPRHAAPPGGGHLSVQGPCQLRDLVGVTEVGHDVEGCRHDAGRNFLDALVFSVDQKRGSAGQAGFLPDPAGESCLMCATLAEMMQ